MNKKNLMPHVAQPVKPLTIQDLPTELIELSNEALFQVWGGRSRNLCDAQWLREHPEANR
jgi:bacteriocin leader peptide (microcyclamide/patellamide family)